MLSIEKVKFTYFDVFPLMELISVLCKSISRHLKRPIHTSPAPAPAPAY